VKNKKKDTDSETDPESDDFINGRQNDEAERSGAKVKNFKEAKPNTRQAQKLDPQPDTAVFSQSRTLTKTQIDLKSQTPKVATDQNLLPNNFSVA